MAGPESRVLGKADTPGFPWRRPPQTTAEEATESTPLPVHSQPPKYLERRRVNRAKHTVSSPETVPQATATFFTCSDLLSWDSSWNPAGNTSVALPPRERPPRPGGPARAGEHVELPALTPPARQQFPRSLPEMDFKRGTIFDTCPHSSVTSVPWVSSMDHMVHFYLSFLSFYLPWKQHPQSTAKPPTCGLPSIGPAQAVCLETQTFWQDPWAPQLTG